MLKRAVIREELVAITGDYRSAIILNQFLYWSERIRDVDKYLDEEYQRSKEKILLEAKTSGWIYKSVKELREETMINMAENTVIKYVNQLVDQGFLDKRNNPRYKTDKTFQYRINLLLILKSLQNSGYDNKNLVNHCFSLFSISENAISISENAISNFENHIQRIPTEITSEITSEEKNTSCSSTNLQTNMFATENTAETSHEVSVCQSKRLPKSEITTSELLQTIKHPDLWKKFWDAYPRKNNKRSAILAWNKALRRYGEQEIMKIPDIVSKISSGIWAGKDKEFIPMASTFLNQDRWIDEVEIENSKRNNRERMAAKVAAMREEKQNGKNN